MRFRRPDGSVLICGLILLGLALAHVLTYTASEPFFNNDETRHVMTGVFMRDLFFDRPWSSPRDYAVHYYSQYPALGILVWPPLFYAVEGLVMAGFGTAVLVAKCLVFLFAALACVYFFLLVRWTHDTRTAATATTLFAFSPLFFSFSRQVMLEVPTLALALAATYHFVRYLDLERQRDIALAALASAAAVLTRSSAMYLLPLFVLLPLLRKQSAVLRRREVWLWATIAGLIVLPFYAIAAAYHTNVQLATAFGRDGFAPRGLGLRNLVFYPLSLPQQIGWPALFPAGAGVVVAASARHRWKALPYLLTAVVVYFAFSPLAILSPRYVIYWIPALMFFAACALVAFSGLFQARVVGGLATAFVVAATAATALRQTVPFVRGYREAARYVISNTQQSPVSLFDGWLDGNFTYQIRRLDPGRRHAVVRADKVLYSFHLAPHVNPRQFATDEAEVLAILRNHDPEFIVVEEPQLDLHRTTTSDLLRAVLRSNSDEFVREIVIPVESNLAAFSGVNLEVYRRLRVSAR